MQSATLFSIARICMYDYVVCDSLGCEDQCPPGDGCGTAKLGLNLQREQRLKKTASRCRLPAGRYWMST